MPRDEVYEEAMRIHTITLKKAADHDGKDMTIEERMEYWQLFLE